jgi:ATP-dependent Clp protease ATP-binding subunit ClpC
MFERFTERARRVVVLSQEEARALRHNYIGTEHLLLGLLREGEGVAATALESLGVTLERAREQVGEITPPGKDSPAGHMPFTPRAKKVLELSLRESMEHGSSFIGTGHLLLAIIREGEGVAAQVITRLGGGLEQAGERVTGLVRSSAAEGTEGAERTSALRRMSMRVPTDMIVARFDDLGTRLDDIAGQLSEITARLAALEQRLPAPPDAAPPDTAPPETGPAAAG